VTTADSGAPQDRQKFLVLFYKKEQCFFFVKKKQKTFIRFGAWS